MKPYDNNYIYDKVKEYNDSISEGRIGNFEIIKKSNNNNILRKKNSENITAIKI